MLEEYVGPTQFQWSRTQTELVRAALSFLPEELRVYKHGMIKMLEGVPTPEEVEAASPFESIRSGEIMPLFEKYFDIVVVKKLGGTLQQLLFNGIAHNFQRNPGGDRYVEAIISFENVLIDQELIPSDFVVVIGKPRANTDVAREENSLLTELRSARLELEAARAELDHMKSTRGWRYLSRYGKFKHRYLLPALRLFRR